MATSPSAPRGTGPNRAFRELRGQRSPGEFAAAVRRAARDIGERVSCDARYIGRVEAGEIRCPNYAYERVFLHMFPGRTLADLGFQPRETVRGRRAQGRIDTPVRATEHRSGQTTGQRNGKNHVIDENEESDVLRRAFMTGGSAAVASLTPLGGRPAAAQAAAVPDRLPLTALAVPARVGTAEAAAMEQAVRDIRLLDDRHGANAIYRPASESLRTAYALLDAGTRRPALSDRLHAGAAELAISVGWLAHDSGRYGDARSHYAEALATARVSGNAALEAHAFCNTAFLARDTRRPREAVQAAHAGQQAARELGSDRLLSLLSLREAGGWAAMNDRRGCEQALAHAGALFERGPSAADPEWMSFFGEAELAGLQAQCRAALGDWPRAVQYARRAVELQLPHFKRNIALFSAELAGDLTGRGEPEEAAAVGHQVLDLLDGVQSNRIAGMLDGIAGDLAPHQQEPSVAAFLVRCRAG